ncbi:probable disease resistance protein At5g66900 [Abrus precatorius]|uniref:Probable disease resistance protein At5g66900 n=1 Tax=Abrus precatorius TaxID=3816 RepID=A0A8B8KXT7_ABRPR|nr:probable disease resistance protein At5g66900 [Abrus precatorius]XP_027348722.1 probable disease resistance protein At5g66900 [Abrus precatorius]
MSDYFKGVGCDKLVIMGENTQLVTLSTLFQEALRMVKDIVDKGLKNKWNRRILRSTLKDMNALVVEIKQFNEHLNPPREEINILIKEKDAGEEVVCKSCSRNIWWFRFLSWLPLYGDRLRHYKNGSLAADGNLVKDIKVTLYKVREIIELLDEENFMQKLNVVGTPMKCPFGVPKNPEFTVGLDLPLSKLKTDVLRDGVSILMLTGLGGLGKTTLATKLCWDGEVKGKFKDNILFVTFSQTPKLKSIVERLFEHYGYPVPEFRSDEDAIKRFGLLLRKIEGTPMLLVLDDVWPGSEALVEKFTFQISDYKILVTSRVAFPRFGTPCILKPLPHEDAMTLFRHYAFLKKRSSTIPDEELVQKVVRYCKGLPLAIKVIGRSLSYRPYALWQKMVEEMSQGHSILDSNTELLTSLQKLMDVLEDSPIIKECFMDLGLFPEDQRIPVNALIDMWAELYGLDDDGIEAMDTIKKLESMNLADVLVARKNTGDTDNYYYNIHFIVLHDLLRELAICQSTRESIEQRKRLIIDTNEIKSGWWHGEKHQGMMVRMVSKCLRWGVKQNPQQQVAARTLSISTDETCTSCLSHLQSIQAEVLILNLRTKEYSFPEFMEKMSKLKVLLVTNYGFHPSKLDNFKLLGSISNLKRIRLERISVPHLGALKNLKKLSLYMCSNISQAFENDKIQNSDTFPKLVDLDIDYCKDVIGLPTGVCDITPLKKLNITNCHKLKSLPQEIGKLESLEILRLSSCTGLEGLPGSIVRLLNLRLLDISNCINLPSLPEDIGKLCNLRNLYMTSCARCELPYSIVNLDNLKAVACDEETAASWEAFEAMLPNLKIEIPHIDVNLNWLHSISS